jgi:tRNA nucleotidyltransferase (CCA-adding enzyme)
MFPISYSREGLEKIGLEAGKKIIKRLGGKYEVAYAEHPYVKGKFGEFTIDVVPCYKVESASKMKSSVDRTPFHNKYIMANLKPKMTDDVRLLKQFCKAMDIYGSDIRTLGFSGYLCELLIIKYKNFKKLIDSARKWKFGVFIDLESHCKINRPTEHFKCQPLIVIDPTDPKRNVAASLSDENFMRFVETCRRFYEKPSIKFFEIDKSVIKKTEFRKHVKKRGTDFLLIEFKRPKVVDDILWSQMRKTSARINHLLEEDEFKIFERNVWSDDAHSYLIFEMKVCVLPELRKLIGPPIYSKRHSDEFRKKYMNCNVYIEEGRWVADVKRKYRKCEVLLKGFLRKSKKILLKEGVRSYIAKSVSRGFKILKSNDVERLIEKNKDFAIFLKKYFERQV